MRGTAMKLVFKMWNFLAHLMVYVKTLPTYLNAHAKVQKSIFDVQFPGNRFEFDMTLNDF